MHSMPGSRTRPLSRAGPAQSRRGRTAILRQSRRHADRRGGHGADEDYLVHRNANHGGAFRASRESDAMVHDTRAALADFLGAARPEEISFGQNMTSLTLHVSRSLAARALRRGTRSCVTRLDHDANVSPWLLAARDRGCMVRWVDFDPADCTWSAEELARQVTHAHEARCRGHGLQRHGHHQSGCRGGADRP